MFTLYKTIYHIFVDHVNWILLTSLQRLIHIYCEETNDIAFVDELFWLGVDWNMQQSY